jgi:hypothetical protein
LHRVQALPFERTVLEQAVARLGCTHTSFVILCVLFPASFFPLVLPILLLVLLLLLLLFFLEV